MEGWSALQQVGVLSYHPQSLFESHSVAMSYSLSGRAGSKTILINCWWVEDRFSGSLMCPEIQFWNRLCMLFFGLCKTRENSNFRKNGKIVISVKIQNFFRSRMMKQISPLESSREI